MVTAKVLSPEWAQLQDCGGHNTKLEPCLGEARLKQRACH